MGKQAQRTVATFEDLTHGDENRDGEEVEVTEEEGGARVRWCARRQRWILLPPAKEAS